MVNTIYYLLLARKSKHTIRRIFLDFQKDSEGGKKEIKIL